MNVGTDLSEKMKTLDQALMDVTEAVDKLWTSNDLTWSLISKPTLKLASLK
jgi:hypothetical protein